jgi:cell division protein FtsL
MNEQQTIRRRKQQPQQVERPHGWMRASDHTAASGDADAQRRRSRAPAGTSLLLFLCVVVLGGMGIVRVHASTRVLAVGGEITEYTEEQHSLLEEKRRLSAERAYLRHPDTIEEMARDRLGMVPIAPELVQQIRVQEATP